MREEEKPIIYRPAVIDFVTVSTEYCKQLEQCRETQKEVFIDTLCKLLPMVYLKMSLLPAMEEVDGYNQDYVTEEDYNFIQSSLAEIFGENDAYLDTFKDDFKYSEEAILSTISEGLADVYQPLRNLIEIYRQGFDDAMEVALYDCCEQFKVYWGQSLLNALRAVHTVRYGMSNQ